MLVILFILTVAEPQLSPESYTPAPPSYDGLYSSKGSGPYQVVQVSYAISACVLYYSCYSYLISGEHVITVSTM